jgi:hypothetical protein
LETKDALESELKSLQGYSVDYAKKQIVDKYSKTGKLVKLGGEE